MIADFYSSAAALYDGGWRAEDKEQLIEEYDLTEDEAERICYFLYGFDGKLLTAFIDLEGKESTEFDDMDIIADNKQGARENLAKHFIELGAKAELSNTSVGVLITLPNGNELYYYGFDKCED